MPNFQYRALTQSGELVNGSILAPTAAEVARRIEYLGLVPIDTAEERTPILPRFDLSMLSRPRAEDVTVFTRDLALLLKAGARINDALELLSTDVDVGRLRATVAKVRAAVVAGESFAEAISLYPSLFPALYVELVRVGEASGTLDHILEVVGAERVRTEALRQRVADALRYPAFVLCAAGAVLMFFLLFVLPQFSSVLRDFNAQIDPFLRACMAFSSFLRAHGNAIGVAALALIIGGWIALRRPGVRAFIARTASRLPLISPLLGYHRTALFCRNLGVLLSSGVPLTTTLRILTDMMTASTGDASAWAKAVDRVRHGGKLSDSLADGAALPSMAVRMLRLGEETGQLPMLAGRVAEFYEAKLQRSLDRVVGIAGPLAIIAISIVVGGLIVSVMTALLSVSQVVG
jgi:general secretion pathway protein F